MSKKTGTFSFESSREEYRSITSSLINRSFEWKNKQINILLEQTMLHLGELNAFSKYYPEIRKFLPMFAIRESVASAMMEGQEADIQKVFLEKDVVSEIINHTKAMAWGVKELKRFPLSIRVIKQAHQMLFSHIDTQDNYGGKFREHNQIKLKYSRDTDYIPPNRHQLKILINDGKKFWHNDKLELPQLIKMGISLYQFDNILPFLDGNGKTARMLILFELMDLKFLRYPILCFSVFCMQNRMEYYRRLNLVRTKNDLEQWLVFFLGGIIKSVKQSNKILTNLYGLNLYYHRQIEEQIGIKRRDTAKQLLELFYHKPFLTVNEIKEKLNISFQASNILMRHFIQLDLVRNATSGKRNRVFFLWRYVDLFDIDISSIRKD